MSLKGYQWLYNDEIVMSYQFKDQVLDIWKSVPEKELNDFKDFIKDQDFEISEIVYHNNSVITEDE